VFLGIKKGCSEKKKGAPIKTYKKGIWEWGGEKSLLLDTARERSATKCEKPQRKRAQKNILRYFHGEWKSLADLPVSTRKGKPLTCRSFQGKGNLSGPYPSGK